MAFPLRIQAQMIGYTARETLVTSADSLANMKFELAQTFVGIREVIVTGVLREAKPLPPRTPAPQPPVGGSSIQYRGRNTYGGFLTPFLRQVRRALGGK
jgi:hypothetical protein